MSVCVTKKSVYLFLKERSLVSSSYNLGSGVKAPSLIARDHVGKITTLILHCHTHIARELYDIILN